MKKNFCKVRRGHCLSLVWIVSFLLWGNVTMAALPIQEAKLSIQQRSVALSRVFYEIEKQTGYSFLVRNNDINMNEKVSIDVKNKSVEEVLEMLFVGKNIRYKVEGEHISPAIKTKCNYRIGYGCGKRTSYWCFCCGNGIY